MASAIDCRVGCVVWDWLFDRRLFGRTFGVKQTSSSCALVRASSRSSKCAFRKVPFSVAFTVTSTIAYGRMTDLREFSAEPGVH